MATAPQQPRDIVTALTSAGAAPRRVVELADGRALAYWHNDHGQTRYERPRHHSLSIYTQAGEQTSRQVNGKAVSHGFPGAVCLFPAGSQSQWNIEGPFEFLHFYFTDQDLHHCLEATWDRDPAALRLEEQYQIEDGILAQAGQLLTMSDWNSPGQTQAMDHLAHWLILQVAGRYGAASLTEPDVSGRFSRSRQNTLARQIDEALAHPLDLATMASWVSLSPYHFARLFRASFGMAPYQYVQEQRLLRARRLLQHPSAKITVVALECGFSDHSQFSRSFRKRFGVSPSGFRSSGH